MKPYTDEELRALPDVLWAEQARRILNVGEDGLRTLRESLQEALAAAERSYCKEPTETNRQAAQHARDRSIVAFQLAHTYRYSKKALLIQARREDMLVNHVNGNRPVPAVRR